MNPTRDDDLVLVVSSPGRKAARIPMDRPRLLLGRSHSCDVGIPDPRASQRHAEIVRFDLGYLIRDLGSTNGTFLNDRRVVEALLPLEAVVRIGRTRMRLVSADLAQPPGLESGSLSVNSLLNSLGEGDGRGQGSAEVLRLRTLVQIGRELSEIAAEGPLLEAAAQAVFRLLATDRVYVLTLRDGHLIPRVAKHAGGAAANLELGVSSGMLHEAVREKRVIHTTDARQDVRFRCRESVANLKIRSAVTTPLLVGKRVLGALHTDRSRPTAYQKPDLEILALLGQQVAAALGRVRLVSNLFSRNADLERARAELLRTSGELQRMNRELEARVQERTREKDRLMAMVAHDVRSPLTAVQLFVDVISTQPAILEGDPDLRDQLDATHDLLRRANNLLEDLVDASAVALGALRVEPRRTQLGPVLRAVTAPWGRVATASGFRMALALAERLPEVRCDPRRVEQIVQNLLHNACKFSSVGDVVTVEARPSPDGVEVSVNDQGPGVPEADRERILGTFTQGSVRRAGKGLGLAIAQQLALAHGRGLRVEEAEGGGARFVLTLPLAAPPATPAEPGAHAELSPTLPPAPARADAGKPDPNDTLIEQRARGR